jgi:hypothetical protein
MIDSPLAQALGAPVIEADGFTLGTLGTVFYADDTNQPTWLGVVGATRPLLVPVAGARVEADGVHVPWPGAQIEAAPSVPGTHVPRHVENALLNHYGLGAGLVRHVEEAAVGKRVVEAGSVRAHKYVRTQPVSVPVEVEVERLEILRIPVGREAAGATWEDDSIDLTLHVQTANLRKRVVARERVTIATQVGSETRTLVDRVRVEHVALEGDAIDR